MNDYSKPYITLQLLMKEFHEATLKGQYQVAYEISVDIAEIANQLEHVAMELANESNA